MSELTKDLSAYNAARAQAIADEVEAIYTGKVRERMETKAALERGAVGREGARLSDPGVVSSFWPGG